MKTTPLKAGAKSLSRGSTFSAELRPLKRSPSKAKPKGISPAAKSQRAKIRDRACIHCAQGPCDPAHVIDRSLGGDDDARAVVPLCRRCHDLYDAHRLSILEDMEPHWRSELAYAVELVGLLATVRRVTGEVYLPERRAA